MKDTRGRAEDCINKLYTKRTLQYVYFRINTINAAAEVHISFNEFEWALIMVLRLLNAER